MRLFVLAWLAGGFALQREAGLPSFPWGTLGLAALAAAALARGHRATRVVIAALAGIACGFGYAAWRAELRVADALPFAWEARDIEVVGVVAGLPQVTESGTRFPFEVEEALTEGAVVPGDVAIT